MDSARLLFCGLLVSIALHAQAMKDNSELERIPPVLRGKTKDKREEPDPAKIRADAVDKLLDLSEDAIARWRELETIYAEYLADDSTFSGLIAFLDAETGEGISASDVLPEEVKAIQKLYQHTIRAIQVARDREEYFDKDIGLVKQLRRLLQSKKFQIQECMDVINAELLNGYNEEMVFSDLKIIARGYRFALESFVSNVYQEWLTCLLSEIAKLQQDPNFSGFECEAGVATEMRQISFHILLVIDKLEAAGAEFDDSVATFKTAVEAAGDGCYNTDRMLEKIDALISVGVSRRENEVAAVAKNQAFFNAFQRWLDFFTTTKRGVANNKTKLVRMLKKLLDDTIAGTKVPPER